MAEFERTVIGKSDGQERIEVGITTFNNKQYLDVRRYYWNVELGEYKPTKKGISIPIEDSKEFVRESRIMLEPVLAKLYGN